jgi:hypothetical protein
MTLVETGTRAMLGAVFGPPATGETDYARKLLGLLGSDMLVLADRGFGAAAFLTDLAGTGAQFLVRLRVTRRLQGAARLDDGSYLSRIDDLTVRIITADITFTCADGTCYTANYRLATTLSCSGRTLDGPLLGRSATEAAIAGFEVGGNREVGHVDKSSDRAYSRSAGRVGRRCRKSG